MSRLPKPPNSDFKHFGHVLRHYRETIADRLREGSPGIALIQASALDIIRCLKTHDYQISPASYSAIENGDSLPRDPEEFINRVAKCLAIKPESEEWWTLTLYATHGLMSQKLGVETANRVVLLSKEDICKYSKQSRERNRTN